MQEKCNRKMMMLASSVKRLAAVCVAFAGINRHGDEYAFSFGFVHRDRLQQAGTMYQHVCNCRENGQLLRSHQHNWTWVNDTEQGHKDRVERILVGQIVLDLQN